MKYYSFEHGNLDRTKFLRTKAFRKMGGECFFMKQGTRQNVGRFPSRCP